jgi:hypothetical protein
MNLPAEEPQELRMAVADLLLNAVTGGRGLASVGNERSTGDELKTDR